MNGKNTVALTFAVFFAVLLLWWLSLPAKPVTVVIGENASARQIAEALYKADAIASRVAFRAAVKLSGTAKQLKAGTYQIPARTSLFGVIRMLSSGRGMYSKVTIPEGFTAAEIAGELYARGIVNGDKFVKLVAGKRLEGYLFPDTYYFDRNLPEQVVVDKMLREFNRNFTPEMLSRAAELKMSEAKIVTLASIIEKEAVLPQERAHISGVFYNRMRKGWYLESCATVQYALGEHKSVLSYKDVKVDSPYNTYRCYGLPPGPICNPGRESLKAALYPEKTDDMFFVASSSGAHVFSRYFSEHINNKHQMKKQRRQGKPSSINN